MPASPLHTFWLSLTWLYVWRWCAVGWAFLLGFPLLGLFAVRPMLLGAFDLSLVGMFFVSEAVFFLCFSLRLLGTIVVAYGPERLNLEVPAWVTWIRRPQAGWPGYILWIALGLPMVGACIWVSATGEDWVEPGVGYGMARDAIWTPLTAEALAARAGHLEGIDWMRVLLLSASSVLGLGAALVIFIFTLWVHRRGVKRLAKAGAAQVPEDAPLYADPMIPKWLGRWFEHAAKSDAWEWLNWLPERLGRIMRWCFGAPGYYHPVTHQLRSGHRLYVLMALAFLVLYLGILSVPFWMPWIAKLVGLNFRLEPPALLYLVILVLLIVWWLYALSFALDHYRIPAALPLLVLILCTQFMPSTQYRFTAYPEEGRAPLPADAPLDQQEKAALEREAGVITAAELLRRPSAEGMPVLVTAEGGGIHSGSWAAHVLRLLENGYREARQKAVVSHPEDPKPADSFAKHVVCVSGVSGGSYGLMYWADSFGRPGGPDQPGAGFDDGLFHRLTVERAMRSSLSAVTRGLVLNDIWQGFTPIPGWFAGVPAIGRLDRASLMEGEWAREPRLRPESGEKYENAPLGDARMSAWRRDATADIRPAVMFNSMNADNGQPVVFSTTQIDRHEERPHWEYWRQRRGEDVNVVTAARCSASFPFICPAATPSTDEAGSMHLVDGGYFDNFGMASINRWLKSAVEVYDKEQEALMNEWREALRQADAPAPVTHDPAAQALWLEKVAAISKLPPLQVLPKSILVVQIRGGRSTLFPELDDVAWDPHGSTGFVYQATAPVIGLINMRGAAQKWHNDQEYIELIARLKRLYVTVHTAVFHYPYTQAPLSWHLTRSQKQQIECVTLQAPPTNESFDKMEDGRVIKDGSEGWRDRWADWATYRTQKELNASWKVVLDHFQLPLPPASPPK